MLLVKVLDTVHILTVFRNYIEFRLIQSCIILNLASLLMVTLHVRAVTCVKSTANLCLQSHHHFTK